MKFWIVLIGLLFPLFSIGQKEDHELEAHVIQETLPQLLDANPNSIASLLKGGEMYELLIESLQFSVMMDSTSDTSQLRMELDALSDSIATILETNKIRVTLSDTLFAYNYSPAYTEYKDGWIDTIDLREKESWEYTEMDLIEVFQTNSAYRGLSTPVDLEFIELIKAHVHSASTNKRIDVSQFNTQHYEFVNHLPENHDSLTKEGLLIHAIRVYRPVFNEVKDKACYLYAGQARNGPWREFVFVEKHDNKWVFIESYGSEHIDSNEDWLDQ